MLNPINHVPLSVASWSSSSNESILLLFLFKDDNDRVGLSVMLLLGSLECYFEAPGTLK